MLMNLTSRDKIAFIEGTEKKDNYLVALHRHFTRCNATVCV